MASSSGNSSGSAQLQNYASEGDLHRPVDQRKRKRMQSNRESARRSRMRKQQHLDDLGAQVAQLRKENNQILTSINITTQHLMNVESENSVLKAQMGELSQRLESLDEILGYIDGGVGHGHGGGFETTPVADHNSFINPWNMLHVNQPIMATADMLHQYY